MNPQKTHLLRETALDILDSIVTLGGDVCVRTLAEDTGREREHVFRACIRLQEAAQARCQNPDARPFDTRWSIDLTSGCLSLPSPRGRRCQLRSGSGGLYSPGTSKRTLPDHGTCSADPCATMPAIEAAT